MPESSRAPVAADLDWMLALNNAHAIELSLLDGARLVHLLGTSFRARVVATDAALIAFDQGADYDSPNFLWFRGRHDRFVYIDRVVVSPEARSRGLARTLYADLFAAARTAGHSRVCCEVNVAPPNPASDAFHEALGFVETGRANLSDRAKTVRYLERRV